MKQSQKLGWPLILILSFLPALLWAISPYSNKDFSTLTGLSYSMGQVTALVGTAMFSLSLFLSARVHFFEKIFKGMNVVYEKHSQLGQMALMFLLVHPLALLSVYGTTLSSATKFLLPGTNWALNWGIFSLGTMLLLIVITLYLRPRYNLWKWTHKFLGFAFFMGAMHGWMISSTISQDLLLRTYIFGLAGLGLLAFSYRTLFGAFLVKRFNYEVQSVTALGEGVIQIKLMPRSQVMNYEAGQFIFVSFKDPSVSKEVHPFSISSAPQDGSIEITVKNLGDYTSVLAQLKKGAEARVEGPYGVFNFRNKRSKKQIWIAGGIGITPFLGMARSIKESEDFQVDLYYCVQDDAEAVVWDELNALSETSKGRLKLIKHPSKSCGRISADLIEKESNGLSEKDILMCAPPSMIRGLRQQFTLKHVPQTHLHSEEFSF